MLVYFVLIPIVLLFLRLSYSKKEGKRISYIPVFISALILILFAGLRASSVGTDTNNYVGIYNSFSSYKGSVFDMQTSLEIGYLFLQKIALLFSNEYWAILIATALMSVLPFYYVINKLSYNEVLSLFIYITLAVYLVFFNAGRQGIAVAISSVSIIYLIKRSMFKYFACIIIASLFHNTAIILLPFYFLLTRKVTIKSTLLYLFGGLVSFAFLSVFLSFFSSDIEARYAVYEDRGATGGDLLAAFFVFLSLFLFIIRNKISDKNLKMFEVYFNYCLFTSIIYIVVIFTGSDVNFIRLTNYFAIGYVLIWPIVFEDVEIFKSNIIKVMFVIIHLLFYGVYLNQMASLTPYSLNPLIF